MKRKLADFGAFTPAEKRLRDEVGLGEIVVFGDNVPGADADSPIITAEFLRYPLLGRSVLPGLSADRPIATEILLIR